MPLPVPSPRKLMRSALPTPSKPKPEPPTASNTSIPRTTAAIRPPSVRSSRPSSAISSRPPSRSTRPPSSSNAMPPPASTSRPRHPASASTTSLRSTASTETTTTTREKKSSSFSPAKLLRRATGRSKESLTDKHKDAKPAKGEPTRGGSLRMPSKPASSGGMFGLGRSASSKSAKATPQDIPAPASAAAARARPVNIPAPPAKSGIPPPSGSASSSRLGHRRGGSTGSPPTKELRKPAFSTLQRDYGAQPAKPKPPATSIPPPQLDPATVAAQTKLLQHSCLYIHAAATSHQLTVSAHGKLKSRFDTLAAKHRATSQQVVARQKDANFRAVAAVLEAPAAGVVNRRDTIRGPDEKIQAFSEAVKTLDSLASNELAALSAAFSSWIEGYTPPVPSAEGWMQGRERWLEGLGRGWREECARIARRVEGCVRDVEGVVAVLVGMGEGGVLGCVAERWLDVGRGMGEECAGMGVVEERVVEREKGAIREAVGMVGGEGVGGVEVGIWSR